MSFTRRSAFAASALLVLGLVAWAGPAVSRDLQEVPSEVTNHEQSLHFFGRVVTPKFTSCRNHREVVLLRVEAGPGPDTRIGSDHTNQFGEWTIDLPRADSLIGRKVQARVTHDTIRRGDTTYLCRADNAPRITVKG